MRHHTKLLMPLLLGTALLAGCSSSGDVETSSEPAMPGLEQDDTDGSAGGARDQAVEPAPGAAPEAPGEADGPTSGSSTFDQERKIRRGNLTLEVDDLKASADQVRDVALSLGGYVSDESISQADTTNDYSYRYEEDYQGTDMSVMVPPTYPGSGRLVVKVETSKLGEAMDKLSELGKEVSRSTSETSVETALVDLESRISTQTKSVGRIRVLLDQAVDLGDIVTIENELSQREADLESLLAQQESIGGQAATAEITVTLTTPEAQTKTKEEEDEGFLQGLKGGLDALLGSTLVLTTIALALLPFLVVGGLIYLLVRALLKRRSRRRAQTTTDTHPTHPPQTPPGTDTNE